MKSVSSTGVRGAGAAAAVVRRWPVPHIPGRPLVVAHRGAHDEAPENTIPAFQLAFEKHKADAIELDVHLTATGELVVFHDDDALRMTGNPLRIADATFEQVRALKLPEYKGVPQQIPTLEEVLRALPRDKIIYVELKTDRPHGDPAMSRATAELLKRSPNPERFYIHSWSDEALAHFHSVFPEAPTALLVDDVWKDSPVKER